jgi:hypothetical protein
MARACLSVCARAGEVCRWHPSRILKVNVAEQKAFVHFNGWSDR